MAIEAMGAEDICKVNSAARAHCQGGDLAAQLTQHGLGEFGNDVAEKQQIS